MKKKLIIISFILLMIFSFAYVFFNIHKIEKKNNIDETQNLQRDNYVEKFAKQGKVQKFKDSGDESGYSGVIISGKDKLVKATTLDEFTGISDRLSSTLNELVKITENKNVLSTEYFNENKSFLSEDFGMKTQSEFTKFIKHIGYTEDKNFKIEKCSIENVTKENGAIYIYMLINGSKVKAAVYIANSNTTNDVIYNIHYKPNN